MKSALKLTVAALALVSFTGMAQAEGDAAKGEKVFKKCKACHKVGEKAKKGVGPALNNIIGAAAGKQEGYKYSKAMIAKGADGLVWDDANLDKYLKKPKDLVKGTKMAFPGLKKDADRANVIAYLKKFTQ